MVGSEEDERWKNGAEYVYSHKPRIRIESWLSKAGFMCVRMTHTKSTLDLRDLNAMRLDNAHLSGSGETFEEELVDRLTRDFVNTLGEYNWAVDSRVWMINRVLHELQDRATALINEDDGPFLGCTASIVNVSGPSGDDWSPRYLTVGTVRVAQLDGELEKPLVWQKSPWLERVLDKRTQWGKSPESALSAAPLGSEAQLE